MLSQEEIDSLALEFIDVIKINNKSPRLSTIIRNLDFLVLRRSYQYKRYNNGKDIEQEGFQGLFEALKTFKPNLSSFSWWADKYISTRINRAAQNYSLIKIPSEERGVIQFLDTDELHYNYDPIDILHNKYISQRITEFYNNLPIDDKVIFNFYYGIEDITSNIDDIMLRFNLSKNEIIYSLKRLRRQLKKSFFIC